jgi:hypothetical protein
VSAPLIALLSLTLAAAAASATISINAASPRRSRVGNTPDQSCCSRSRKLGLALSGVTLAAAVPSATLSINATALAPRCSVSAPLIALSDVTLADAAASATLSINAASPPQLRRQHSRSMPLRRAAAASATLPINAAALALGGLGGTGRSLLGVCTADRPVGCDACRRSCVGHALDQRCCSRSRKLERHRLLGARCLHG